MIRSLAAPIALFAGALALYAATLPRTITLEDAGLFQMMCYLGGIGHPPGYPLFALACQALVQVPHIVNGNLVSALFAALAVMMFYLNVRRLTGDMALAVLAAVAWAVGVTFWSQAIIIEVYSLAAFMFMLVWWLLLVFNETGRARYWLFACLAFGLSLSNHWPLMLLSTPALVAAAWPSRERLVGWVMPRDLSRPLIAGSIGLFLLGLAPYATLLQPNPTIAVFGPIDSPLEFWRYVTRSAYSDSYPTADMTDKLAYLGWSVQYSLNQWGWPALAVAIAGLLASTRVLQMHVWLTFALLWAGSTVLLVALLDFEYSPYLRAVFKPYPVIATASVALWFVFGIRLIGSFLSGLTPRANWLVTVTAAVAIVASNFPRLDRSGAGLVESYAETILNLMPEHAVLFVHGDNYTGPIGYLHTVRGERPDVELRDWDNLVFSNRLSAPDAPVSAQLRQNESFILQSSRPVFLTERVVTPRIDYGAFVQYNPGGTNEYAFPRALVAYVDLLVAAYEGDLVFDDHEQYFVYQSLIRFARQYVGFAVERRSTGMPVEIGERVLRLQQIFPGMLVTLELLVPLLGTEVEKDQLLELAADAEQVIPAHATPTSKALFYSLVASVHAAEPVNPARAREYLQLSVETLPSPENPAFCRLVDRYRTDGEPELALALLSRAPGADCGQASRGARSQSARSN